MKTILVALDAAPSARDVLTTAAELARSGAARLVLFRAGDVPGDLREAQSSHEGQRFTARILDEVRQKLEAARREFRLPEDTALRVDPGPAGPGILAAIDAERADLVLVGAHGFNPLEGSLGKVTRELVERAPCSVLVVRARR